MAIPVRRRGRFQIGGRSRVERIKRWVRIGGFFVLVFSAVALVAATVAVAAISTYYSGGMTSGQLASTSGYYSRDWNRVYRPGGYNFWLGYQASGTNTISWVGPNAWDNPFVDNRNATSAAAWCNNSSSDWVSPVTCQTTTP